MSYPEGSTCARTEVISPGINCHHCPIAASQEDEAAILRAVHLQRLRRPAHLPVNVAWQCRVQVLRDVLACLSVTDVEGLACRHLSSELLCERCLHCSKRLESDVKRLQLTEAYSFTEEADYIEGITTCLSTLMCARKAARVLIRNAISMTAPA